MNKFYFSEDIKKIPDLLAEELRLNGNSEDETNTFFEDNDIFFEVYEIELRAISERLMDNLSEHIQEDDKIEKNERLQKQERFSEIWGSGLAWLRRYYTFSLDMCEEFHKLSNEFNLISTKTNLEKALYLLNARGILVYSEIICLLESGFPDGAYAHYRILYELWAVAEFLFHDGDSDNLALAFLNSSNKEPKNEASHYKWANSSKRFDTVERVSISAIVKESHKTFMRRPGDETSLRQLGKNHEFPNILIHPSAMGLEILSDSFPDAKTIGMANPAISSSIMLNELNSLYLQLFADEMNGENENLYIPENTFICMELLSSLVNEKIIPIFNEIEHGEEDA
ncbi:MAG: DUF5677 domain-containing protein [Defluviitaleaceae bacterium]|nr:DUF5677 domain-containing protein [Defluviitaleaceae bacterium]